ncbi:MAG: hypothetical protein L0027_09815, partial [Candidatus Rokubacteria bacterium]|nr:hypothetical protein [Candidatus Rokubacteria bacterium]
MRPVPVFLAMALAAPLAAAQTYGPALRTVEGRIERAQPARRTSAAPHVPRAGELRVVDRLPH